MTGQGQRIEGALESCSAAEYALVNMLLEQTLHESEVSFSVTFLLYASVSLYGSRQSVKSVVNIQGRDWL